MKNRKTTICGILASTLASISLLPGIPDIWGKILIALSIAATSIGHTFAADADAPSTPPTPKQEPK